MQASQHELEQSKSSSKQKSKPLTKIWEDVKKDYKLIGVIGEGSYGTVVKGKSRATDQYVAIKLIKKLG
jgi:serine/threonine protein kinase